MCGISGLLDFNNRIVLKKSLLKSMSEHNKFRGPDHSGILLKSNYNYNIGLVHNRLSIIDLTKEANQPMISNNEQYYLSFNGEIYNYLALKEELIKCGKKFKTQSDSEVIMYAYEKWGINKCLEKLDGMFAFALFDTTIETLFLSRDRFGEKPLYYSLSNNFISFSSDIRSFNCLPIKKTLNHYSLGYYFSEMCTPISSTIWNEISKLEPGFFISFSKSESKKTRYWNTDYKNKNDSSLEDVVRDSEILLKSSVKRQLVSDVDVGCLLSGGIDSSLVSLFAAENYHKKIKTFSVGFNSETHNELQYSKKIAEYIDSDHYEIIVNPKKLDQVNKLILEYGEPFADTSKIPNYFITKYAAKEVKVCLGGDGGDELFAGYRTYNQGLRMESWRNLSAGKNLISAMARFTKIKKFKYLGGIINEDSLIVATALFRNIGFNSEEIRSLTNNAIISSAMDIEHQRIVEESKDYTNNIFDSILYSSIKTRLSNDYLVKTDRASMYNSLELRSPFLDRRLQEYLSRQHSYILMPKGENKFISKEILKKYFDENFVNRPKKGFEMPIAELIKKEWKKDIQQTLLNKNYMIELNSKFIHKLLNDHFQGKADNSKKIWNLYVFNRWSENNKTANF